MNNTGHFTLPRAEREISWCPLTHLREWFITYLQVCYVPVNVHGGGDTVFGDVFVAVRIRFTVDRVDTGNRNSLLPQSYVTVNGAVTG